jgi:hypothetical protein
MHSQPSTGSHVLANESRSTRLSWLKPPASTVGTGKRPSRNRIAPSKAERASPIPGANNVRYEYRKLIDPGKRS